TCLLLVLLCSNRTVLFSSINVARLAPDTTNTNTNHILQKSCATPDAGCIILGHAIYNRNKANNKRSNAYCFIRTTSLVVLVYETRKFIELTLNNHALQNTVKK